MDRKDNQVNLCTHLIPDYDAMWLSEKWRKETSNILEIVEKSLIVPEWGQNYQACHHQHPHLQTFLD